MEGEEHREKIYLSIENHIKDIDFVYILVYEYQIWSPNLPPEKLCEFLVNNKEIVEVIRAYTICSRLHRLRAHLVPYISKGMGLHYLGKCGYLVGAITNPRETNPRKTNTRHNKLKT